MSKELSVSTKLGLYPHSVTYHLGLRINEYEIEDKYGILDKPSNFPSDLSVEKFNNYLYEADNLTKKLDGYTLQSLNYDRSEVYAKVIRSISEINTFISEKGWAELSDGSKIYQAKDPQIKILSDIEYENHYPEFVANIEYVDISGPSKITTYFYADDTQYAKYLGDSSLSDEARELEIAKIITAKKEIEIVNDNLHFGTEETKDHLINLILQSAIKTYEPEYMIEQDNLEQEDDDFAMEVE